MNLRILVFTLLTLYNCNYENFLEESISIFSNLERSPSNIPGSNNVYVVDVDQEFYGKIVKRLLLQTDENDNIKSVSFTMNEVIDENFYNDFRSQYGEPYMTLCVESIMRLNEISLQDGLLIKEGESNTTNCSFIENPLFIIWLYKKYKITIEINRVQSISRITYKSL